MFIRFLCIFRYFMRLTIANVSATIKTHGVQFLQKEGISMTRLLCLGDSITDCGRLFSRDPLGNGYVKLLSRMLHDNGHIFSVENRGIDGFTIERLLHNADSWVETSDPDMITILIGINDIGIMMNTRRTSEQQHSLMNEFSTRYELLAKKLSNITAGRKLFFLEPFVFPWPRCYVSWIPLLAQMSGQILKISRKYGAVFVPLQNELNQEAERLGMAAITVDGIHLTPQGHEFLAKKLYALITSER